MAAFSKKISPVEITYQHYQHFYEHLHVLTQEALDHADLTVLTGAIGAAALLKNCLWCYIHTLHDSNSVLLEQLQKSHKKYQEMGEALAERLLDLHCRLLSLYILQDADSLDWENPKPFCEMERGSYVIQMWWLYMQGTKEDLWNTVPPKMAQRVFSGMLNETLGILTVRYSQACPSESRNTLLTVDISNLLLCVAKLLPAVCDNAEELMGFSLNLHSKILRDIHIKCQQLLLCLILRGSPLDLLYKAFRNGVENHGLFISRGNGPSPWIMLALQNVFPEYPKNIHSFSDLTPTCSTALEVSVLLAQPQPNWSQLVKVLVIRHYKILNLIFNTAIKFLSDINFRRPCKEQEDCGDFLCPRDGTCKCVDSEMPLLTERHYYNIVVSVAHVFFCVGSSEDLSTKFLSIVDKVPGWANCFDRRHVWNQNRPPWYQAILDLVKPLLLPVAKTVIHASQTGASMYQAMSIVLACFGQLWDCANPVISKVCLLIQDILPISVIPLGHSALLQVLISALYTELLEYSEVDVKKSVKFENVLDGNTKVEEEQKLKEGNSNELQKNSFGSFDGTDSSVQSIALALAEALCSIDEDNKHTEQIDAFLQQAKEGLESDSAGNLTDNLEQNRPKLEVIASDLLVTSYGKTSLKTLFHFIQHNKDWLNQNLGVTSDGRENVLPNRAHSKPNPLLHTMFHIDDRPFDQLLTGEWVFNWLDLLHAPIGVSPERVWNQISLRWEFQEESVSHLSTQDAQLVASLTKILKQA